MNGSDSDREALGKGGSSGGGKKGGANRSSLGDRADSTFGSESSQAESGRGARALLLQIA